MLGCVVVHDTGHKALCCTRRLQPKCSPRPADTTIACLSCPPRATIRRATVRPHTKVPLQSENTVQVRPVIVPLPIRQPASGLYLSTRPEAYLATCAVAKSVNHIIIIRTLREFYANDERVNASQAISQQLSIQPSQRSPQVLRNNIQSQLHLIAASTPRDVLRRTDTVTPWQ